MPNFSAVSVIIPTHNRADSLAAVLTHLRDQVRDVPMQVIVVADGCTDTTESVVSAFAGSLDCRLIVQAGKGPSCARNAGAKVASNDLLIFIDDDIMVCENFVAAHVKAHKELPAKNSVVIGYCPPNLPRKRGFYTAYLRQWWEVMFDRMEEPGRRFQYVDLLSGNFSLSKSLFESLRGFDEELRCHEDFELGIRLIKAKAQFAFVRQAMGIHNTVTTEHDSLSRKFEEGRADWSIARLHPDQASSLPFHKSSECRRTLAVASLPLIPKILDAVHRVGAGVASALSMRRKWLHRTYSRYNLAYCQGVLAEAGGLKQVKAALLPAPSSHPCLSNLDYDLAPGLSVVEAQLDVDRPAGASLWLGEHFVGSMWADDAVERLHGGHLRPWLAINGWHSLLSAGGLEKLGDEHNSRLPSRSTQNARVRAI